MDNNPAGASRQDEEKTPESSCQGVVDMTAVVDTTQCRVFELPSNDPFLPELKQVGDSLDSITSHLASNKDGVKFYPRNLMRNPPLTMKRLCERLEERYNTDSHTLVYLAHCLSVSLNINPLTGAPQSPSNTLCDVIVLSQHAPVLVLTVGTKTPDSQQHNLNIAKGLVSAVRNFTSEHFSALCGVLEEADLETSETFDTALKDISESSSSFCNPDSLSMTESKFKQILKALAAVVSVSKGAQVVRASTQVDLSEEEEDEDLWFLTKEQFLLLTENIDTCELVVVWAGPRTGSSTLMVEVATRLEKRGRTLLVAHSRSLCQSARQHKVCSRVVERDDFLANQDDACAMLEHVDHVVAEDVPEVLLCREGRKVHTWLCLKVKDKTCPSTACSKSPIYTSGHPAAEARAVPPATMTPVFSTREMKAEVRTPGQPARTPVYKTPKTEDSTMLKTRAPVVSIVTRQPKLVDTISFRLDVDTKNPRIYDFLVLRVQNSQVIVAVDIDNCRIKTFYSDNGELKTGFMTIDKDAAGITNLGNMAAVTVPSSRIIRVIEVTPDLKPHSVIHTERRYSDIAYLGDNKMAACAPKDGFACVDFIDCTGKIYKSISRDTEGEILFSNPLVIEPVSSTSVLVYDKERNSIQCVTDRGQVLFRYQPDRKLKFPCGMTVSPTGEVLVADSGQQKVTLLDREGNYVRDILTRQDDTVYPYRVACDHTGRLYVALYFKELKVFEFT